MNARLAISTPKSHFYLFELLICYVLDIGDVVGISRTDEDQNKTKQYHQSEQKDEILRSHLN